MLVCPAELHCGPMTSSNDGLWKPCALASITLPREDTEQTAIGLESGGGTDSFSAIGHLCHSGPATGFTLLFLDGSPRLKSADTE